MKFRVLLLSILAMAGVVPLSAQVAAFNGFCTNGGKSAVVSGLSSSNKLEQIIPSCTITIYFTGTTTPVPGASITKDAIGTPLGNPFTADSLSAIAPGKWLFFAPTNQGYDVVMSGGIAPLTYTSPVTITDLQVGGGGGGGGPTILTNGTPNFSQTLLNHVNPAAFNGLNFTFSNPSGGIETFGVTGQLANAGILHPQTTVNGQNCVLGASCTITAGSTTTFEHNDVALTGQFAANPQIFDVNDTLPAPPTGAVNVIWQPDATTGRMSAYVPSFSSFQMATPAPDTNNGVFITGTTCTPTTSNSTLTALNTCGGSSGEMSSDPGGISNHNVIITQVFQAPPLPSYINPANVIAVYAMAYTSQYGSAAYSFVCTGASNLKSAPVNTLTTTLMSGVTGSNFSSSTCTAQLNQSVYGTYGGFTVNQIGYWIEDNIDTLPTPANINVTPQLFFQANTNTLGVYLQNGLAPLLVSQLPDPFINSNDAYLVSDNTATSGACVGTGTPSGAPTLCYSTGAAWDVLPGGSSVTWPSSADLVLSNGTNSPAGLTPVNGDCVIGSGGAWIAGTCSGGSSGFPILLGSTSIAASSTTTAVTGLSVNGVTLTTGDPSTEYLNGAGSYTTPSGSGIGYPSGTGIPEVTTGTSWGATYNAGNTIPANFISTLNQNTTGNAATATNLASYPTLCSGGQFSEGLSSGSNNCGTPSGTGSAGIPYGADSGTASAYVVSSTTPTVSSITAGTTVIFTPAHTNTSTAPTLNVASTGAKTVIRVGGGALFLGDINATSSEAVVIYDGTAWELQNPATSVLQGSNATGVWLSNIAPTGAESVAVGWATTSTSGDTVLGYNAIGGGDDVSIGTFSLYYGSSGSNTSVGYQALKYANHSGGTASNNVAFGLNAGFANSGSASNMTNSGYFGYNTGPTTGSVTNQWLFGYNLQDTCSNCQDFGNSSITQTTISGKLTVKDASGSPSGVLPTPQLFSALSACSTSTVGWYVITDSTSTTWGATVSSGTGTPATPYVTLFCDGANYTVMGK